MPGAACERREWDGEAVVFVHASGDTHALSVEASALLAAMSGQAGPPRAAVQWLALAGFDIEGPDPDAQADALMAQLGATGLIERELP